MRKIAATYIFPISSPPLKNGILIVDENGEVLDLIDTKGKLTEQAGLEYYNGILVPGFVNCHCHLELSFLKNKIEPGTGLGKFLGEINQLRNKRGESDLDAANEAAKEMRHNGIVAVGDISNGLASLEIKKESYLETYTFVEVFGFLPERAERSFLWAEEVLKLCNLLGLPASIVPHSPYSVSDSLFAKIRIHAEKNNGLVSMHNEESEAENQFFQTGGGEIADHLKKNIGLDISGWLPTGKNSLPSVTDKLPLKNQWLLVHNTFTSKEDIRFLKKRKNMDDIYFVLCPNSNLYISKRLPPVNLFREEKLNLCLGTDSLASNSELSILTEMKTIQENFPDINLQEIVSWATLIGAKSLKMDKRLGSFEKGKKPGINLLVKTDLLHLKLTAETQVKRL